MNRLFFSRLLDNTLTYTWVIYTLVSTLFIFCLERDWNGTGGILMCLIYWFFDLRLVRISVFVGYFIILVFRVWLYWKEPIMTIDRTSMVKGSNASQERSFQEQCLAANGYRQRITWWLKTGIIRFGYDFSSFVFYLLYIIYPLLLIPIMQKMCIYFQSRLSVILYWLRYVSWMQRSAARVFWNREIN